MHHIPPCAAAAAAEAVTGEAEDAQLTPQDQMVLRHMQALKPTWQMLIAGAPDAWHGRLTSLVRMSLLHAFRGQQATDIIVVSLYSC